MVSRVPSWLGAADLLLADADVLTGARRAALLLFTALWLAANQRRPSLNQPIRARDSTFSACSPASWCNQTAARNGQKTSKYQI